MMEGHSTYRLCLHMIRVICMYMHVTVVSMARQLTTDMVAQMTIQ